MEVVEMQDVLNRNLYFVKRKTGVARVTNDYDILDPETENLVMECREEKIGCFSRMLRFAELKRMMPFEMSVRAGDGRKVLGISRGIPVTVSHVKVVDENEDLIGGFKLKPFSIGGSFDVLDANDNLVCLLKGDFVGWNFRFLTPSGIELARVTRKWAGIRKELLVGADNHMLFIDDAVPRNSATRQLILASVLCIGMVIKIDIP